VGKNYLCSDWKQELVTFSKFLERMRTNKSSPMEPTYLAQHPLFDQVYKYRDVWCICLSVLGVCHTKPMAIGLTRMGR